MVLGIAEFVTASPRSLGERRSILPVIQGLGRDYPQLRAFAVVPSWPGEDGLRCVADLEQGNEVIAHLSVIPCFDKGQRLKF